MCPDQQREDFSFTDSCKENWISSQHPLTYNFFLFLRNDLALTLKFNSVAHQKFYHFFIFYFIPSNLPVLPHSFHITPEKIRSSSTEPWPSREPRLPQSGQAFQGHPWLSHPHGLKFIENPVQFLPHLSESKLFCGENPHLSDMICLSKNSPGSWLINNYLRMYSLWSNCLIPNLQY